jgi:nucleotide-binding universal stress UspA family protein
LLRFTESTPPSHPRLFSGHPKEVILDEAEKWDADLIVVGSHGYRGWQRFLLGSVSQAIASHAPCSVQIVRLPAEKEQS